MKISVFWNVTFQSIISLLVTFIYFYLMKWITTGIHDCLQTKEIVNQWILLIFNYMQPSKVHIIILLFGL
jgi:hypothetical protein